MPKETKGHLGIHDAHEHCCNCLIGALANARNYEIKRLADSKAKMDGIMAGIAAKQYNK